MRQGSLMSCPSTTLSVRSATKTSATNQVVFARWSGVILALWPLSILTDPFSQAMNANVRIFLDIFCDVGWLRRPAVFWFAHSGAEQGAIKDEQVCLVTNCLLDAEIVSAVP